MTRARRRGVPWASYADGMGLAALRRRWQRTRASEGYRFARRFVLWFALVHFLVAFFALEQGAAIPATAAAVAWASPAFGLDAAREGASVTFDGAFTYFIEPGCTGVAVAGLMLAAVLAYPAGWRRRAAGVAFCIPFTFAVNLLRLDTMGWLGVHAPGLFHAVHEVGWEAGVILVGAAGFALWVRACEALDEGGARALRVRSALASAGLFLALFVAATWLAVASGAHRPLGRALVAATTPAGQALWGLQYPPPHLAVLVKPELSLTAALGYACLFLATRGAPMAQRLRAACWGAFVPVVLAAAAGALLLGGARLGEVDAHPVSSTFFAFAYLGAPMLAWVLWTWRLRRVPAHVPAS